MRGQTNYPSVVREAEQIVRDVQGISEGVTIPVWLFASGAGLIFGIILGPAIMATSREGSAYLAKMATKRMGG